MKGRKKSTSEKAPGRAVIKDWHFYLVCKIKFSIFIHSLKNNLFRYRWVGIILSVLSVAKDSGDWTWKWAPHISQIYDYFFFLRSAWKNKAHGIKPWIEQGPEELVIFQRLCLPSSRINCPQQEKVKWDSRGPTWMKKDLPTELSYKKSSLQELKAGIKDLGEIWRHWVCRDVVRKAEVHLELNLTKDMKANKRGFYGPFSSKRGIMKGHFWMGQGTWC